MDKLIGATNIEAAIALATDAGRLALAPFLTAGFPSRDGFSDLLHDVMAEGDLIELGIPFSDPIADGPTIQRASQIALRNHVTISWVLGLVNSISISKPVIIMSYINPLMAYGFSNLARDCADSGVSGFIVPDLPIEESKSLANELSNCGVALIQLVSPVTPEVRMKSLCDRSTGFVYATTIMGTTGATEAINAQVGTYLNRVRELSHIPLLAGFGIRTVEDVQKIMGCCDGCIVGSALIEIIEHGEDPIPFLRELRRSLSTSQHKE